jgi:hypothetical protein
MPDFGSGPKPFARTATAPAHFSRNPSTSRLFSREKTHGTLQLGVQTSHIGHETGLQLYIAHLPPALFKVINLVVLSLSMLASHLKSLELSTYILTGNNKLTEIPPAIKNLTQLRELNLSQNSLAFLPPEINELRIQKLALFPNPFLLPPEISNPTSSRRLGPLVHPHGPVQPLSELALRRLMLPYHLHDGAGTSLKDLYALPINAEDWAIDDDTLGIMEHAVPGSSGIPGSNAMDIMSSRCHNTSHAGRPFIFRRACSVRLEWFTAIAGSAVSPPVPVEWRGCSWRCLDFLEQELESKPSIQEKTVIFNEMSIFQAGNDAEGRPIDLSDDED